MFPVRFHPANPSIVLLNILIALYNSAYEDISGNAIDEYMAIFAQKTMQFVRAPDENVFIPRKHSNLILKKKKKKKLFPTDNLLSLQPSRNYTPSPPA